MCVHFCIERKVSEVPCIPIVSYISKGSFKKNHTVYDFFFSHPYDAHTVLGQVGIMSSPLRNSGCGDGTGPYLEKNNKI